MSTRTRFRAPHSAAAALSASPSTPALMAMVSAGGSLRHPASRAAAMMHVHAALMLLRPSVFLSPIAVRRQAPTGSEHPPRTKARAPLRSLYSRQIETPGRSDSPSEGRAPPRPAASRRVSAVLAEPGNAAAASRGRAHLHRVRP